jgi:hypothetical protein
VVAPAEAERHWRAMRELAWVPDGCGLLKVPLYPGRIAELDAALAEVASTAAATPRAVYMAGGQQALVAWPRELELDDFDRRLVQLGLSGLVVRGRSGHRRLGRKAAEAAIERARRALDPHGRFRDP